MPLNYPMRVMAKARLLIPGAMLLGVIAFALFTQAKLPAEAQSIEIIDIALVSGFQDSFLGHFKRGRASIAADFNLDGRIDYYIGNPGDESFVMINVPDPLGRFHFEPVQVLMDGDLAWGAVASDFDNDGDYDLFITNGANEGIGADRLFMNRWIENGETVLSFEDVTIAAGIAGPVPEGSLDPIAVASANAVVADYDQDGDTDIFVSVNITPESLPALLGRNILWRNNGDGTFTDVTDEVGLGTTHEPTRHSTFLDIDNDGDVDLYENNFRGVNRLWRNKLAETGIAEFEDVTVEFSTFPDETIGMPFNSFVSAAADFNNDGFEDLFAFGRLTDGIQDAGGPYGNGHALFLNVGGTGFVNVAESAGVNQGFDLIPMFQGVMGSQVGDLNADGVPDLFFGNGGPAGGQSNQLFLSTSEIGAPPTYFDASVLIGFPAPENPDAPPGSYPRFPYRTHGTNFVDLNNDGVLEMSIINGGEASRPDVVREPNRLFLFVNSGGGIPNFLKIRPVGNGNTVSMDAIGTRLALTVSGNGGDPVTIFKTLFAGSAFSAQNGFQIHFGLDQIDTIHELRVTWPDGVVETINDGLELNKSYLVHRDPTPGAAVVEE